MEDVDEKSDGAGEEVVATAEAGIEDAEANKTEELVELTRLGVPATVYDDGVVNSDTVELLSEGGGALGWKGDLDVSPVISLFCPSSLASSASNEDTASLW